MTRRAERFKYWRDPLFVAASAAYVANRWLTPALHIALWRTHFADLLFVPVGLPLWLWLERRVGWRIDDRMPRWGEITFVLVIWSVAAELVAPQLFARATADVWDVAAYAAGAVTAGLSWQILET
ncbi:MAG: hypothetical protein AB7Q29_10060 [Vicinamibacterales bacterium]